MEMVLVIQRRKSDFSLVSFSLVFRTDVKVFGHFPIPPLPVILSGTQMLYSRTLNLMVL